MRAPVLHQVFVWAWSRETASPQGSLRTSLGHLCWPQDVGGAEAFVQGHLLEFLPFLPLSSLCHPARERWQRVRKESWAGKDLISELRSKVPADSRSWCARAYLQASTHPRAPSPLENTEWEWFARRLLTQGQSKQQRTVGRYESWIWKKAGLLLWRLLERKTIFKGFSFMNINQWLLFSKHFPCVLWDTCYTQDIIKEC